VDIETKIGFLALGRSTGIQRGQAAIVQSQGYSMTWYGVLLGGSFQSMPNTPDSGKCEHFQPADLIAMASRFLEDQAVPESEWEGRRFEWGGQIDSPPFTGLVLGCKRKENQWVVTKIDRRKTGVTPDEVGFREIV
jgi:hypothetical protein